MIGIAAFAFVLVAPVIQVVTVPTASPTPAPSSPFIYSASASGSRVNVGSVVTSSGSFPVLLGCNTNAGIHLTNSGAGVNLPGLNSGTIDTTADTLASPVEAKSSATIQNVNLLGGAVTASLITSDSATSHDSSGFATSGSGTFTGLRVLGLPINAAVAPNTKITLPGLGYVILNQQTAAKNALSALLTVNGIEAVVTTTNTLGIAPNTILIVSHATTGLQGPTVGTLDGTAFGSSLKAGSVFLSGPSFVANQACLGTNGVVRTNSGAGVNVPGVLNTGTISNTDEGKVAAGSAAGEMTSTVQNVNLLKSIVQATVVKADAHAGKNGTALTFSDTGSTFASLTVAGFPAINANVAPNTSVPLAGLGTLYLHRIIHSPSSITVRMIEVVVTQSNSLGLAIGTDLQIAVAEASAH